MEGGGSTETYRHLVPGERYRIAVAFTDFDGRRWEAGTELVFVSHSYFHYDAGHTFYVRIDGRDDAIRLSDSVGTAAERTILAELGAVIVAV